MLIDGTLIATLSCSQSYIDKIKPIAIVLAAYQAETANNETCNPTNNKCSSNPTHKIGIIDSSGTETLNEGKIEFKDNQMNSDSLMAVIDPLPAGDLTVRLQIDKNVGSETATGYISLPDLRIGKTK